VLVGNRSSSLTGEKHKKREGNRSMEPGAIHWEERIPTCKAMTKKKIAGLLSRKEESEPKKGSLGKAEIQVCSRLNRSKKRCHR